MISAICNYFSKRSAPAKIIRSVELVCIIVPAASSHFLGHNREKNSSNAKQSLSSRISHMHLCRHQLTVELDNRHRRLLSASTAPLLGLFAAVASSSVPFAPVAAAPMECVPSRAAAKAIFIASGWSERRSRSNGRLACLLASLRLSLLYTLVLIKQRTLQLQHSTLAASASTARSQRGRVAERSGEAQEASSSHLSNRRCSGKRVLIQLIIGIVTRTLHL
jgi:hypothetical protein